MTRIDIIEPLSQYGALNAFTKGIQKGFEAKGLETRLLDFQIRENILTHIKDLPEFTFAFNGILSDEGSPLLSEVTGTPHIGYIVDPPYRFERLLSAPRTALIYFDKTYQEMSLKSMEASFFLPHAVDAAQSRDLNAEKEIDILFPMTFVDPYAMRASWKTKFSPQVQKILENTLEMVFSNNEIPFLDAFTEVLYESRLEEKFPYIEGLSDLETVIKGEGELRLLQALDGLEITLYGNWGRVLNQLPVKNKSKLIIREGIDFDDMLKVYAQSKVVLNATPKVRRGTHERVLEAYMSNAYPVTDYNLFQEEYFSDLCLFYDYSNLQTLPDQLQLLLKDDDKRYESQKKGREVVMRHFTWEKRAEEILHIYEQEWGGISKSR